jgi:hypothetical protein
MPSRPQQFRASTDSNPQPGRRACSCHFGKQRENHMAKTNYQVTFNGKVVGIRKSDRIYTHAVVVQDDADAFYHWAHNYVPNETDRKNFAYDSKRAVQIVEQYLAEWKYQKPDYVESQISEAKAKVEGGFEAYAERLRRRSRCTRIGWPRAASCPMSRGGAVAPTSRRRPRPGAISSARATGAALISSPSSPSRSHRPG